MDLVRKNRILIACLFFSLGWLFAGLVRQLLSVGPSKPFRDRFVLLMVSSSKFDVCSTSSLICSPMAQAYSSLSDSLMVKLHPIYLEEIAVDTPGLPAALLGLRRHPLMTMALALAEDPEQVATVVPPLKLRDRHFVVLTSLVVCAQHDATIHACQPLLQALSADVFTPGERYQVAECLSVIGRTHRRGNDLSTAIDIYREGLRLVEDLEPRITTAALHHNLGMAYSHLDDHDSAATAFEESARIESSLGRAKFAKEELALAAASRGNQTIPTATSASFGETATILKLIQSGASQRQAGNMAGALNDFLQARQLALRSGNPELLATVAQNLCGIFFYQGESERAESILVEALDALKTHPQSATYAGLLAKLASVHSSLGNYDRAEAEFKESLGIALAEEWTEIIDDCEYGLSQIAIERRDYELAHRMLLPVLARRRAATKPVRYGLHLAVLAIHHAILRLAQRSPENPVRRKRAVRELSKAAILMFSPHVRRRHTATNLVKFGNALNQLGMTSYERGMFEESLNYHEAAFSTRRGRDMRGSAESAHWLGMLYEKSGHARRALAYYTQSVRFYERVRNQISTGAESRSHFLEHVGSYYYDAARLACIETRGNLGYWVLQRIQNRTLLESVATGVANRPAELTEKVFQKETALHTRMRSVAGDPLASHDVALKLARFYREECPAATEYVAWRMGYPIGPARLLNSLKHHGSGAAYLELIELEEHVGDDTLSEVFGVCARAGDRSLRSLYAEGLAASQGRAIPARGQPARNVFNAIQSVLGGPGALFVVAHGPLANLPIHSLPAGDQLFIERQPVRYLPHATFLERDRWFPKPAWSQFSVLGDSCSNLPAARTEAEIVADLLGVEAKVGPSVDRAAVRDALCGSDVVHIAGHAVFDSRDAMNSGLATSDGIVTPEDIRRWPIRATFVMLNACESGLQGTGLGNELGGFVRSLLLGGVRHVVCTLQRVDDDVAKEFAERMYSQMFASEQADPVRSMWLSQLALAEKYRMRPELWNPFILVG